MSDAPGSGGPQDPPWAFPPTSATQDSPPPAPPPAYTPPVFAPAPPAPAGASIIAIEPPAPKRAPLRGWVIALAILLVAALAATALLAVQLFTLRSSLDDAVQRIDEQQQQIEEQQQLLDEKQSFGAAMSTLMETVRAFDGLPMADIVPLEEYETQARAAWNQRYSLAGMQSRVANVVADIEELEALLAGAEAQRATNASGTPGEAVLDALGAGFVTTVYDDASAVCGGPAMGCVSSDDPYVVHLDADDFAQEYTDDWGRTFVAHHEFAHVLQFTNPGPTEAALATFGDDWEFMADCYALTVLDRWTLERRVWTSRTTYWDVTYGYGRVCDAAQRQAIRDWLGQVGFRYRTISQ